MGLEDNVLGLCGVKGGGTCVAVTNEGNLRMIATADGSGLYPTEAGNETSA